MCPTNIEAISDECVNCMYHACTIVTYMTKYSVSYSCASTSCCIVTCDGCTSEDDCETSVPVTCVSEEDAVSKICAMSVFCTSEADVDEADSDAEIYLIVFF